MISVLEAMSEAMRMRASCGALHLGVKHAPCGPSTGGPRDSYLRRDVSLLRAQYLADEAQVTCAFDRAVVRTCEYCRAVVANEKLGVIRSGKVAMLVDTGSPLSGWTERAWAAPGGSACCVAPSGARGRGGLLGRVARHVRRSAVPSRRPVTVSGEGVALCQKSLDNPS